MLSSRSIDTLIDLVENKLTDIVPFDRDDVREIKGLEACVNELRELRTGGGAAAPKRRGRLSPGTNDQVFATSAAASRAVA